MEVYLIYILIFAIALVVSMTAVIVLTKKKKKASLSKPQSEMPSSAPIMPSNASISAQTNPLDLKIEFEHIEPLSLHDQSRLVEIKGKKLLSRIDNAIPGTAQAVVNSAMVQNYSKALASSGNLYQVIIPPGAQLSRSLDMAGASRGFYRGSNGIRGHADLIAYENNIGDGLAVASTVNAIMNVASVVVGQYYMTQINNRLDNVSKQLDRIESFQENELKAKITALVAAVQKASMFQYEVLQDNDVRNRELMHLKTLEHECAELLGQANLTINDFSQKRDLSFADYEDCVIHIQSYLGYQEILIDLMGKISELTYALNLGAITRENAFAMCEPYTKQAEAALDNLYNWHQFNLQQFGINTLEGKRKRQGLNAVLMSIPALFKDELHYKGISEPTVKMIDHQIDATAEIKFCDQIDQYQSNVRLIAKDGKLYYLPAEA